MKRPQTLQENICLIMWIGVDALKHYKAFLILNYIYMRILRTDGGGESYADERLRTLRQMLSYHELKHIYMLHDHKGDLCVIWEKQPKLEEKNLISNAWEFFNEYNIEHKLITFKEL